MDLRLRGPQALPADRLRRTRAAALIAALLLAIAPAVPACAAGPPASDGRDASEGPYTRGEASRDGTGKFYMGREIAQVMGHRGIGWLERPEREREERTDLLLDLLPLAPGDRVVDVGAGSGYFTFPIAERVAPDGRVFAVDIQPEMLERIEATARETGAANVVPVEGAVDDLQLPAEAVGTVDLALMVDAYHEFSHPREMLASIASALRPGGLVVLVEYRAEDPDVPIKPLHKMSEAQVRRELWASGLEFVKNDASLPQQHVLIFRKSGPGMIGGPQALSTVPPGNDDGPGTSSSPATASPPAAAA